MKYILSIIALMLCLSSFGQSLPYQQVTHSFNSEDDTLIGSVIWDPGDDYKVAISSIVISTYGTAGSRIILWMGDSTPVINSIDTSMEYSYTYDSTLTLVIDTVTFYNRRNLPAIDTIITYDSTYVLESIDTTLSDSTQVIDTAYVNVSDTIYTDGVDQVIGIYTLTPTATTNPSIIFTPQVPIFCNSKNKKLRITTSAGIKLDVLVWGYNW